MNNEETLNITTTVSECSSAACEEVQLVQG